MHEQAPNRSRDRERFDADVSVKFERLERAHGLTLLGNNVLHGRRDMPRFPHVHAVVAAEVPRSGPERRFGSLRKRNGVSGVIEEAN
jgi:hypothetical protein